ncbi:MAG: porin family protein [Gammaproteobacteria bacterium]|nr:porin family protein [Gammaproteobacteria bacterium]
MNRMTLVSGACFLLLLAGTADAEDKRGFAVNFGVGASQIMDKDGDDKFEGNAFGYTIGGEYRFGANFALAGSVFGLGSADDEFNGVDTEIEVKGGDVKMRFIMPVTDGFEFFGQVGHAWYSANLDPGGSNAPFGDTAVEFGLGFDIGSGNLAVRLAGIYLDGSSDEAGALATIGMNYRF